MCICVCSVYMSTLYVLVSVVQVYTGLCMQTSQSSLPSADLRNRFAAPRGFQMHFTCNPSNPSHRAIPSRWGCFTSSCFGVCNQVETDPTQAGHRAPACRGWDRLKRDGEESRKGGRGKALLREREGCSDAVPRAEAGRNILDFTTQAIKHNWITMTES